MTATTPKARIKKGKDLENWICERLKVHTLDARARRSYGSGNSNGIKADIDTSATILGRALGIEAKHVDRLDFNEMWKQAEKLDSLGFEPALVVKRTQDDYLDTKVVIYLETLLRLLAVAK